MTAHYPPPEQQPNAQQQLQQQQQHYPPWRSTAPRKRRHIFRWIFLAIQVLFLAWIISGAASSGNSTGGSCAGLSGQARQTCVDAGHVGTGIGVFLIIILWMAIDVILGVSYLIFRRRS